MFGYLAQLFLALFPGVVAAANTIHTTDTSATTSLAEKIVTTATQSLGVLNQAANVSVTSHPAFTAAVGKVATAISEAANVVDQIHNGVIPPVVPVPAPSVAPTGGTSGTTAPPSTTEGSIE